MLVPLLHPPLPLPLPRIFTSPEKSAMIGEKSGLAFCLSEKRIAAQAIREGRL